MLALTFLQAPFEHYHEHEENNNHPHGFFHTHFRHYHPASSKAEISDIDPDDDAVFQTWCADISHNLIAPVFLLVSICDFTPVEISEPFIVRPISGGHDPPSRPCSSPRAPPV
jgi:hypothetical protein